MECIKNMSNHTNATLIDRYNDNIFAAFSVASFMILIILLFSHWLRREQCKFIAYSNGILFFCSLVTMVADLSTINKEERFYYAYTLVEIVITGIIVNVVGSLVFFKDPEQNTGFFCKGRYESIGTLIWGITVPLALMEMFLAYCMLHKGKTLAGITTIATIFQKVIQVSTFYFGIRHKVPITNKHGGALFLKIMAMYNFGMWLQSIIEGTAPMRMYLNEILHGAEDIVASVYAALTTDFRILCSLLYAEISIDVENWRNGQRIENNNIAQNPPAMRPANINCCSGSGYIFGFFLLLLQFLNALQFLADDPVQPWVNVFGIAAELSVIIHGCFFLWLTWENEEGGVDNGVDITVSLMGIVGIAFWLLKCSLIILIIVTTSLSQKNFTYLTWMTVKYLFRIIGLIFQLILYNKTPASLGYNAHVRGESISYHLVPCLFLSQLSVFVNAAIDSYSYLIEEFITSLHLNNSMFTLHSMGEPLYLGFVVHVFFRLLIVNNNLRGEIINQPNEPAGIAINQARNDGGNVGNVLQGDVNDAANNNLRGDNEPGSDVAVNNQSRNDGGNVENVLQGDVNNADIVAVINHAENDGDAINCGDENVLAADYDHVVNDDDRRELLDDDPQV